MLLNRMDYNRTPQTTAQIKGKASFRCLPDVVGDGDDEDDADGGPGGHAAAQQVRPHLRRSSVVSPSRGRSVAAHAPSPAERIQTRVSGWVGLEEYASGRKHSRIS